ncbi:tetratricopeptide repeat protein [Saccharopolyspora shandongensis]|uniref:tetratricopeptide repeat protein n=1 Tax=Saccharopolyspora shandongensis TaxID=418495 RepID=UPI00343F2084
MLNTGEIADLGVIRRAGAVSLTKEGRTTALNAADVRISGFDRADGWDTRGVSDLPGDPIRGATTSNAVSAAISGNVVQANVIEGGVYVNSSGRVPVGLPYRAGSFPPRAATFQGRDVIGVLARVLESQDAAASDSAVVSGLGGVGKTQVALDYADRVWASGRAELVVWVTASSREAITSSFARLAGELTGLDDADPELGAQRLLEWLAATPTRWLIVLDDLQRPRDLRGLLPPATRTGQVVMTTRRRDAALRGHGRRMIEVGVFTPGEADAYLQAALADQPSLLDGAAQLGAEVGYLPLALAQASAYMRDRALSCADYRQRLTDHRRLASLMPESDALPDDHRETVAATWSLSMEQANCLEPPGVAGPLLQVASLLNANGIPLELFTTEAITCLLTSTLGRDISQEQARDGLGCLHRLSLITLDRSAASQEVRTHALVQRATRDTLAPPQRAVVTRAVADALRQVWPEVERDTVLGQVLRGNADALFHVGGEHLWQPDGHPVLFRAGNSLGDAGLVAHAQDYYRRLQTTAHTHLGPDHPDTLTTRHNLAFWRGEAGDAAGAAAAFEELLADRLQVLGPDHPDTLRTRSDLARWRGNSGDPAGAAAALEELLADRLRVLGPDHPDTLRTRHNLAFWRGEAGDPVGAVTALEELLPDRLRVLGPDHPDTLATRSNLARWRGNSGDPAGAAAALEELLADRLQVLGPDHPDTLRTRHNLARWCGKAGDATGAAAALKEVLADRLRVLGPDHHDTLRTRHNLAFWRGEAGDPVGAVTALEELLPDRLRVLGPDHPDTLRTRHNLAFWRGEAGDPVGAVTAFKKLLADQLRVLSPDHPDIPTTRHNLARWTKRQTHSALTEVSATLPLHSAGRRALPPE